MLCDRDAAHAGPFPRRPRRAAGLALFTALLLIAGGGTTLARSGKVQQDDATLTVHLHTPVLSVRGAPGATASFTLHLGGRILGGAAGTLDGSGRLSATLSAAGQGPGAGGNAPTSALLQPGLSLSATIGLTPLRSIDLPTLTLHADGLRDEIRLEGPDEAPTSGPALVRFRTPSGEESVVEVRDARGRLFVPWPTSWLARPGHVAVLDWPVAEGITISQRWDAPRIVARLGGNRLHGEAPRGARIATTVTRSSAVVLRGDAVQALAGPGESAVFSQALRATPGAPEPALLQAGDQLGVSLDATALLDVRAPMIRARVLPSEDIVAGLAPPEAHLQLLARSGDLRATRTLTVPASGAFSSSLAGSIDLDPDSEVWVEIADAVEPIVWQSRAEAERLSVTLGSALLFGRAAPHSTIASSLKDSDATTTLAEGVASSGPDGAFSLTLREDGRSVAAEPGARLLAVWELGGALDSTLPDLQAYFDAASESVQGIAPPNSRLKVALLGGATTRRLEVRADAAGRFRAPFPGAAATQEAWRGEAALLAGDLLTVIRRFARVEAAVDLGQPEALVRGPHGARIVLELRRAGLPLAAAEVVLGGSGEEPLPPDCVICETRMTLRDGEAFPTPIEAGDIIELIGDGQRTTVEVPRLALEANTLLDRVRGNGRPAESFSLSLGSARGSGGPFPITPDASGFFDLRPGRDFDWSIAAGDRMTLTAVAGPFTFRLAQPVDGLVVDLEEGKVSGAAGPGERLSAGLYEAGGARRGQGAATADGEGRFSFDLRSPTGGRLRPVAGETLVVQAGTRVSTTRIPRLSLEADAITDQVSGLKPEGALRLQAERSSGDRGRRARIDLDSPETDWRIDLAGRLDVAAGTRLNVEHSDEQGNRFLRATRLPQLHARLGDVVVHGHAGAAATVQLSLTRGSTLLATATRTATDEGSFEVELAAAPLPWRLTEGDVLEARWQGGRRAPRAGRMRLVAARIDAVLDADTAAAAGQTHPGTRVEARFGDGQLPTGMPALSARANAEGAYRIGLPDAAPLRAGTRVEVGVLDAEGHRSYAVDRLPYLDLRLARAVLTGRATPRRALTLTLLASPAPGAPPLSATDIIAGAKGSFVAAFESARGHDVPLETGRVIEIQESSGRSEQVVLPRLSASIDHAGRRIHGAAPLLTEVELRLIFFGRPALTLRPMADDQGLWSVAMDALPPSSPADELRRAEARLSIGSGHRVMAVADPAQPTITATPPPGTPPTPIVTDTPPSSSPTPIPIGPPSATPDPRTPTITPTASASPSPTPVRIFLPHAENPPAEPAAGG